MVGESRSSKQFFRDVETHEVIEQIAESRALTIFAGAGVTIDRTGLTWRNLLEGLVRKAQLDDAEASAIHAYGAGRSEMHYASVVRAIFQEKGDEWRRLLSESIHTMLYTEHTWRGGRYAAAIAEVVLAAREAGKKVYVVTTNHDDFIERAILARAKQLGYACNVKALFLEFTKYGESRKNTNSGNEQSEDIRVVHVHGGVLKSSREDSKIGSVVLGEYDFFDYDQRVAETVSNFMVNSNTILVGTGLEDPNLLRSLHAVIKARVILQEERRQEGKPPAPRYKTWSVLTKPQLLGGGTISEEGMRLAKLGLNRRLSQFEVAPVFPDMYSQAHQLLFEVAEELRHRSEHVSYADDAADYQYSRRLGAWWQHWDSALRQPRPGLFKTVELRSATQAEHHELLRSAVDSVRETLAHAVKPESVLKQKDSVKVEAWVRWAPSSSNRMMRCWANSIGPFASESGFRDEELSTTSRIAAVKAFYSGSAELVEGGPRWSKYLAIPIEVAEPGHVSCIAGVVCIGSSRGESLAWENVAPMQRLVREIPTWTRGVFETAGFSVTVRA